MGRKRTLSTLGRLMSALGSDAKGRSWRSAASKRAGELNVGYGWKADLATAGPWANNPVYGSAHFSGR